MRFACRSAASHETRASDEATRQRFEPQMQRATSQRQQAGESLITRSSTRHAGSTIDEDADQDQRITREKKEVPRKDDNLPKE